MVRASFIKRAWFENRSNLLARSINKRYAVDSVSTSLFVPSRRKSLFALLNRIISVNVNWKVVYPLGHGMGMPVSMSCSTVLTCCGIPDSFGNRKVLRAEFVVLW